MLRLKQQFGDLLSTLLMIVAHYSRLLEEKR